MKPPVNFKKRINEVYSTPPHYAFQHKGEMFSIVSAGYDGDCQFWVSSMMERDSMIMNGHTLLIRMEWSSNKAIVRKIKLGCGYDGNIIHTEPFYTHTIKTFQRFVHFVKELVIFLEKNNLLNQN